MLWRDGYIIKSILFVFGSISLFVAWAAFVPLSEGVAAGGTVVVESDRQVVQHLEGGIIKDILVDDGDIVEAGDPLIVLTSSATESAHKQLVFEAATLNVSIVRAEALANGKAVLALPDLQDFDLESEERERILAQQSDLFRDQRQSLKADLELLKERQSGARKSAGLKQAEKETIRGSIEVVKSELQLAEDLLAQQMGRVDRVRSLEKELANLLSNEARLESEIVGAENEARDFAGQIEQVKSKFKQDLAAALIEYRRELEAVNSNLSAAEDSLKRFVLHAPRDGEVFNLRFKTVGGVVRPGEEILEIVPADTGLRALLRIKPSDRSQVLEGLAVRTTISAYRGWQAQPIAGEVINVSADLKMDQATGAEFYEAEIELDADAVSRIDNLAIIPGMPVQAFIYSGKKRTTLDYVLSPLLDSMFRGLRTK